jgi:hypothetical protein
MGDAHLPFSAVQSGLLANARDVRHIKREAHSVAQARN